MVQHTVSTTNSCVESYIHMWAHTPQSQGCAQGNREQQACTFPPLCRAAVTLCQHSATTGLHSTCTQHDCCSSRLAPRCPLPQSPPPPSNPRLLPQRKDGTCMQTTPAGCMLLVLCGCFMPQCRPRLLAACCWCCAGASCPYRPVQVAQPVQ